MSLFSESLVTRGIQVLLVQRIVVLHADGWRAALQLMKEDHLD